MTDPVLTPPSASPDALRRIEEKAWLAGDLAWLKLDAAQTILYEDIRRITASGEERVVVLASRGWGKTFVDLLMCVEACLRKPSQRVAFVTKTKNQGERNIKDSVEAILDGCPKRLRPRYYANRQEYDFYNGSTLTLLGVDSERFQNLRGARFHVCIIDECQDVDHLDYIVRSILDPCVLRVSGRMVLSGTVPEDSAHEFVSLIDEARADNRLLVRTVLESPRVSEHEREVWKKRAGGEDSLTWRREYMCELVYSNDLKVIPEWTPELQAKVVRVEPRPSHFTRYVAMDPGFKDLCAVLYGYWDFVKQLLVVEAETILKGKNTSEVAEAIKLKEQELWGSQLYVAQPVDYRQFTTLGLSSNPFSNPQPYVNGNIYRFSDVAPRVLADLTQLYGITFYPTANDNPDAQIAHVRRMLQAEQVVINPACRTLLKTLHMARRTKNQKDFVRGEEIGHADALMALVYMARNVNRTSNPFPQGAPYAGLEGIGSPKLTPNAQLFKDAWAPSPDQTRFAKKDANPFRFKRFAH